MTTSRDTAALQEALGHHFERPELLAQALTHSSQAREMEAARDSAGRVGDNEQLEFVGDAVLGLITSEELFRRFPHFREGELSKLRAHLVSEKHLIRVARELKLGEYLRLGRGEEKSGGRSKTALLVDALEAVLAALYLEGGLEVVRPVVLRAILLPELERLARSGRMLPLTDYKSALQERLQAAGRSQPAYVLVKEQGPEHRKTFTVEARLRAENGAGVAEFVGRAEGSTKKEAEQEAARQVLDYLASQPAAVAAGESQPS
ncbi:MAG TPA: ribonuclease III [Terriglobales bacterium]|nr:ribonuclease III [Terriglobales bacterium]